MTGDITGDLRRSIIQKETVQSGGRLDVAVRSSNPTAKCRAQPSQPEDRHLIDPINVLVPNLHQKFSRPSLKSSV